MKRYAGQLVLALFLLMGLGVPVSAAEGGVIEIPVSVMAEGSAPDWNTVYTLELTAEGENCPMPAGSRNGIYRMAVKGGSTGTLRLNCHKPGVYDYTLRQIPGKDPDCSYDDRTFRLRLFVTEEGISAVAYDPQGKKVPDILFHNRWAEPAWVTFTAWKTLDGRTPEDGTFRFLLLGEDGKTVAEAENQGRRVEFPALRFDREGTYRYEMKEVAVTGDGITYDRTVYTMTVTVRRDGDYRAEVSILRNGKPCTGMPYFANHTKGAPPQTGDDIGLWVTVLTVSGTALIGICGRKKRNPGC